MPETIHYDIMNGSATTINQNFISSFTKNSIEPENEKICKIIKFTSEWSMHDILLKIPKLDPNKHPNLFIFIIEDENFGFSSQKSFKIELILKTLLELSKNRSMILQLTSVDENIAKVHYKEENFEDFKIVEEVKEAEELQDFSSFLWLYLNVGIENLENVLLEKLPKIENSSLILRFLKTLELSKDFLDKLVLKCAAVGSISNLLAISDGYTDDEGNFHGDLKNHLSQLLGSTSILYIAVQNKNSEVADFLIKNFTNLIQRLPFRHQIEISTSANDTNQFKILCDLLEISDFPFPSNFQSYSNTDPELLEIIEARKKFYECIDREDLNEIEEFVSNHPNLKFAYNLNNKSAFCHALEFKKFESFFNLKAFGFEDRQVKYSEKGITNDEDKAAACRFAALQRKKNINFASSEYQSVQLLLTRTLIFRRYRNSETEEEQWEKITNWYTKIYDTIFGFKIFDAAAQCKELKIIFDFEYKSVENVDLNAGASTLGITYPLDKLIFIGAKPGDEGRTDQEIRGTIVHEICHYVMRLVYQNKMNPYYNDDDENREKFRKILAEIKIMLFPKIQRTFKLSEVDKRFEEIENTGKMQSKDAANDECNGIISSVFTCYDKGAHQLELIVRPAHIQAQFGLDIEVEEKYLKIEEKYKKLFNFFEFVVIPELEKFSLDKRENVQNLNNVIGLLSELKNSKINLTKAKNLDEIINNQVVVPTSNVPKILLLDICKQLDQKYERLLDIQNIFINPHNLEYFYIHNNFKKVLNQKLKLHIFMDCSKEFEGIFEYVTPAVNLKYTLVASSEKKSKKLERRLKGKKLSPTKVAIDYYWMDLTPESHKLLLESKINFQNNSKFPLFELISSEMEAQQDFSAIIDDELLNLLVEKSNIPINVESNEDIAEKHFRILFQARNLFKKYKIKKTLKSFKFEILIEKRGESESNSSRLRYGPSFEITEKSEEMSQDQMLQDVKKDKFVIISDKAGSGKSWMLKNFANKLIELHPKKWTTYVDLKQFIDAIKMETEKVNFLSFMVRIILKSKANYEKEIFKKLYKNGKVCILFDGFDEIAPDCAEFVTKLFQLFQQNGGNQLWIATRDYFENDLKMDLEIGIVYKLDEFTEQHGIDLIAFSRVLHEIKIEIDQSDSELMNQVLSSTNLQNYKDHAEELSKRMLKSQKSPIGLPQFYKMIADILKKNKYLDIELTIFKVFAKCVDIEYVRWTKEQGDIRLEVNVGSQQKNLSYHKVHQLVAMQSLFPEDSNFCDLVFADLAYEWKDVEVAGCGLLTKMGTKFFFTHDTFREFFAANFAMRVLEKREMDEDVCKYLIKFLAIPKNEIIRMFLDEAFKETSNLNHVEKNLPKIAKNFFENHEKLENLSKIFEENLENLANFLMSIFNTGKYSQTKKILDRNNDIIVSSADHRELFLKTQNYIIKFFTKSKDLKKFLRKSEIFLRIFGSPLDMDTIKRFIDKIKNETDSKFIAEALCDVDERRDNVTSFSFCTLNSDVHKIEETFRVLETYIDNNKLIELMLKCDTNGSSILHGCVASRDAGKLRFLWKKLKQVFVSRNSLEHFKQLIKQKTLDGRLHILHYAAHFVDYKFHETLWELLLETFENREELIDLIVTDDVNEACFTRHLLSIKNPHVLKFTLNALGKVFTGNQYKKILKTDPESKINLLVWSIGLEEYEAFRIVWKVFEEFYKSEFLKFLTELDCEGTSVFHRAASYASREILEYMMQELKEIATREKIRKILMEAGFKGLNMLQLAARNNKSADSIQSLWIIIEDYFNPSEVLDLIKYTNDHGYNILFHVVSWNTVEIIELMWTKISTAFDDSALLEYSKCINAFGENILHVLVQRADAEVLYFFWNKLENFYKKLSIHQEFKELFSQKTLEGNKNVLHYVSKCKKVAFYEAFWELLLNTFKNREELKDLILQKDTYGDNFVHNHVLHRLLESTQTYIIIFTFLKLKQNFSSAQFQEIIKSKGCKGNNLLQTAILGTEHIKTHQNLWPVFKDSCESEEEFLEILKKTEVTFCNAISRKEMAIILITCLSACLFVYVDIYFFGATFCFNRR